MNVCRIRSRCGHLFLMFWELGERVGRTGCIPVAVVMTTIVMRNDGNQAALLASILGEDG